MAEYQPAPDRPRRPFRRAPAAPTSGQAEECRVFRNVEPAGRRLTRGTIFALIGFIGLCLLLGAAEGQITAANLHGWYAALVKPPGTPPAMAFAPVWAALYVMIAIAAWLVWLAGEARPVRASLRLWGWQLALNALWPPIFFALQSPVLALLVILGLVAAIGLTIRAFAHISRPAAWLMVPYLAWVCYATWLNAGIWWLNRGI